MRYRFKGLLRDTGKPVEGHVEAPSTDAAYALMSENNIVCEALREDPRMGDYTSPGTGGGGNLMPRGGGDNDVANAIDSALDTSSTQVNVDDLWRKYRGQRVRVIDRDKIRNRVLSVVTTALRQTGGSDGGGRDQTNETLERVEVALKKMFGDAQNLTSEVPVNRAGKPAAPASSGGGEAEAPAGLGEQIERLTEVVLGMEKSLTAMSMALRRGGGGGGYGGGGGGMTGKLMKTVRDPKNDKVLMEIFETNVALQRGAKKNDEKIKAAAAAGTAT